MSSLAKGFTWGGLELEVGENYAWCLVIVVIFMGPRRSKGVRKSFKVINIRGQQTKGETFFVGV